MGYLNEGLLNFFSYSYFIFISFCKLKLRGSAARLLVIGEVRDIILLGLDVRLIVEDYCILYNRILTRF